MLGLLQVFQSYATYNAAFAAPNPDDVEGEEDDAADASTLGGEKRDPFEQFRSDLCKTGSTVLDFLFDFFAHVYDQELNELVKKHSGSIALLPWSELEGDAGTAWRDVVRQLGVHKATVSASEKGGPPDVSSRCLKRVLTEDGADGDDQDRAAEMRKERQEAWNSAQVGRRKYATATHATVKSAQDIQKWFERQKEAYQFNGKAGESHRVFVFSCDTSGSEGPEPWRQTTETKDIGMFLEFMQQQKGPCDVLLSFDGRQGTDRKIMSASMGKN